jgi:hypothetical protein
MVKQLGKGKARPPTKKEKQKRFQEQQLSEVIGSKYVHPLGITIIIVFFVVLYGYLYYKTT